MADGDQRIEVLEDEMKVLKGEVSRTLVDLRALLMREDSPMMTGGLLKRISGSADPAPNITTQITLPPVEESPASNISIVAPAAANQVPSVLAVQPGQESSALAGLPNLGGIEMPEAPGAPGDAVVPSQGDEISATAAAPPPSAPAAGDVSPPAAAPAPADKPDSGREAERDEERARQRKARLQEQEADEEAQRSQRAHRREAEREDEESDRDRRNRRIEQERDEDEDRERRNRRRREEDDDSQRDRPAGRYASEMEDELDRSRRRNKELEYEMERQSNSRAPEVHSEDDLETGPDAESGMGPLGREAEDDGDTMGLDAGGEDSDYATADGYGSDERSDDYLPGAGPDQDTEHDLDHTQPTGWEDEISDGYTGRHDNGIADDREEDSGYPPAFGPPAFGPPALGPPALGPEDNFDSHEYQEEPKINGYNGSRRPRRPDEGRRTYEDSNYEDRNQELGRESQPPPRSPRVSRPLPDGRSEPRGRRPAPDNYGYAPTGGNGQWGQPPAGYQQWPAPQEWAPEPAPMDLNLVSSLVRWASLAKSRVGEKRLSDIIELYVESRSATAGLKEALIHIASIVDDQPPESGHSAQETLDLIAHLHGILTAALPVPEVPKINSQISFGTGKGNANGNGDGDW